MASHPNRTNEVALFTTHIRAKAVTKKTPKDLNHFNNSNLIGSVKLIHASINRNVKCSVSSSSIRRMEPAKARWRNTQFRCLEISAEFCPSGADGRLIAAAWLSKLAEVTALSEGGVFSSPRGSSSRPILEVVCTMPGLTLLI